MALEAEPDAPTDERVDGRRIRRERNRMAVVDAVLEMFSEELLLPTIEDASKRSGLSLRSVYRYFDDPDALMQAAIERNLELVAPHGRIESIGRGPFDERLDRFVEVRVRLYEKAAPGYRAAMHNAVRNPRVRASLDDTRRRLLEQIELQFAPELDAMSTADRTRVVAAADALSQFHAVDLLRRQRQFSVAETISVLRFGLAALFAA
jgi:AcrR family transcriptional regulator